MSIARHHAEWLSLVEPNGPFLSISVLQSIFPQGLDKTASERVRELRSAYEEWLEDGATATIHRAWVEYVLRSLLNLPENAIASGQSIPPHLKCDVPEHGETIRPDLLIHSPGKPHEARILLLIVPAGQGLEKVMAGKRWAASPAARASELLRRSGVRLGLVTNGEQWLLINAPPQQSSGQAQWEADLWQQERVTLDAFVSLLGRHRTFNVPDDEILEALLDKSANDQQEITDQLGYQVRKAVEILVQTLDRIDADQQRQLLRGVSEARVYEAALTVMMRLVFLLSAEQRGLLLLDDALYQQHYAVTTLAGQLRERANQQGEEVLERHYDAWCRLLATWRAVYGGIQHENLRLPAYGGNLFDPDRFAFLEGRSEGSNWRSTPAQPLRIDNRTVLHLLEALQVLRVNIGGTIELQRMSFRALDIEQIGHVYEGLLDHEARRASETMLGLRGSKNQEPEVALSQLQARSGGFHTTQPSSKLVEYLQEITDRSANALRNGLTAQLDLLRSEQLAIACGNDTSLLEEVRPFAGLIRDDDYGRPAIIRAGSLYVTAGTNRRNSGTHYTPRSLTEPIVQHTLEPLVYIGPAEGKAAAEWQLKPVKELLALKLCDMAMGSGAFLVQCCRYLAARVVEAWEEAERKGGRVVKLQGGKVAEGQGSVPNLTVWGERAKGVVEEELIPNEAEERLALARRLVVERCLYGVDKNPLAVEMAKLSLWLVTLAKGRPFTFVDHALKCGDSLVGVTLQQLRTWNLEGSGQPLLETLILDSDIEEMVTLRQQIETMPAHDAHSQAEKGELLRRAEGYVHELKWAADMLVASYYNELPKAKQETLRRALLSHVRNHDDLEPAWLQYADLGDPSTDSGQRLQPFHWQLEFPEVFLEGRGAKGGGMRGFDGFVGNPPFVGGRRIRETLGDRYRVLLDSLYLGTSGNADLSAFFFLRCFYNLQKRGALGLIATNTIAQGDTRQTGLQRIENENGTIYRAVNNMPWPGTAAVVVNVVHIAKGEIKGERKLDNQPVSFISSQLDSQKVHGDPIPLLANTDKSFQGSVVVGMGFVLEPTEAEALFDRDARNRDVIFPYLNGEDLNSNPDQSPSRCVINFFDWPLQRGAKGRWQNADEKRQKEWLRDGIVPDDYPDPVATDYPDCLAILREKVYPVRAQVNREAHRKYWWHYGDKRPALYATIAPLRRVLVTAIVSKYINMIFQPIHMVFMHKLCVFPLESGAHLASLQSIFHQEWAQKYSSTLETRLNYSPSDCFETFPFPLSPNLAISQSLETLGESYHETRRQIMLARHEGLTNTYNRFHKPQETSTDIAGLRRLHTEMDNAVAAAYGWGDLALGHGFHETAQGTRYTIHEAARREVLSRLLALNHERYAEEIKAGLHEKKGKKGRKGDGEMGGKGEDKGQLGFDLG